ncbi:unnamed protein product [Periconia digitata]|uniref:SWI5-dependent HO expression protein 3 n=1 Tax=Periconia digitata TaxID=1303443 RepID=A0A9W4XTC7_9PLEO|nr:unnamed protein product [Periconia digitata]
MVSFSSLAASGSNLLRLPRNRTEPTLSTPPVLPAFDFASSHHQLPTETSQLGSTTPSPSTAGLDAMPMLTAARNTSGPLAVENQHMATEPSSTPTSWSRSNQQSSAQSKTSQYIDKITSENEKLKRELRAEKLKNEDESKRVAAARTKAEESRSEHQSLQILVDTNSRALERKDRKLEEMAAQLETESKRRKAAETRAEEALKMLGDTRSETQRQLAAAYEQKHLAETNLQTARDGYKRITDASDKRLARLKEDVNELRRERLEDADNIKRHVIVTDQLQHELLRHQRSENKMTDVLAEYKREHRKEIDSLIVEMERLQAIVPEKERQADALLQELLETRDKMKWVMAQRQRTGHD